MKPDCKKCVFMIEYQAVKQPDHTIMICSVDVWEEEDGCYKIPEVSEFDPKDCIMFKEAHR